MKIPVSGPSANKGVSQSVGIGKAEKADLAKFSKVLGAEANKIEKSLAAGSDFDSALFDLVDLAASGGSKKEISQKFVKMIFDKNWDGKLFANNARLVKKAVSELVENDPQMSDRLLHQLKRMTQKP